MGGSQSVTVLEHPESCWYFLQIKRGSVIPCVHVRNRSSWREKHWWFQFRWKRKRLFAKLNKELAFLQAKLTCCANGSTEQSTYSGDILEDAHLAQHYGTANVLCNNIEISTTCIILGVGLARVYCVFPLPAKKGEGMSSKGRITQHCGSWECSFRC